MDSVNLLFSGDFAPLAAPDQINHDYFKDLDNIISSADLHITNLECPLTRSEKTIEKTGPPIKAHPEAIELLKQAKVGIACLANNHIFDYGEEGINDTIDLCEGNGIDTIGIISRKDKRDHWLIKEIKGKRIGFLNYCEHEFSVREKGLLGASGYDPVNAFYDISELRPEVDFLIVIYHGGNEYYPLPRPDLKKDFHYLADLGADAVIGHHTHVVSGYEIYKGKPLVYSLGNFFFPYEGEPDSWSEGILCIFNLKEITNIEIIPFYQSKADFRITLLNSNQQNRIIKDIDKLSKIIHDDKILKESWLNYAIPTGRGMAYQILYPSKIDKIIEKLWFTRDFKRERKKRRSLFNILRCTSLKQLILDYLKNEL
jgi:poly-gamma-glutamate synthesis protein (capsule biosynthesis protein)